jgi:hypothetical protein
LFLTGLTIAPAAAGNATAIADYWAANNNTSFNDVQLVTGGANTTAKITDTGVALDLYWGSKTSSTYPSNPSFVLGTGTGANNLNGSANFTDPKTAKMGSFFNKTITYRGAFGPTDWTDGWSEFQPLNKVY